ncbi:MAG: hypothetical protein ABIP97_06035 [Chthoniobacterales bacterium]
MKHTQSALLFVVAFVTTIITHNAVASTTDKPLPSAPARGEDARVRYVNTLIAMHDEIIPLAHSDKWTPEVSARFEAINNALIKAPMPADSAGLSELFVGKWQSPRHDYLYRKDGTWTMLPEDKDTTHGTWSIQGNRLINPLPYTIIMLNNVDFVFTDGKALFFEKRIK